MHLVSFGSVAIFCAVVSVQLAVLCVPFARRGDHAATARWWLAALVAQATRLVLIGAPDALPAANSELLLAAGHAPAALLILAGAAALSGTGAWRGPLLAATGLAAAAIAAAPLYGSKLGLADLALTGLAAGALLAATGLVWRRYWAERWIGYLSVLVPLLVTGLYLLADAVWAAHDHWSTGWGPLAELGLFMATSIGLVHLVQQCAHRGGIAADARLTEAIESLPIGVALFDAEDRMVTCNSKHLSFHPRARQIMVPGRRFEDILHDLAVAGAYKWRGDNLERYIKERLAGRKNATGQPMVLSLGDERWIQVNETRTAGGGIITAWTDTTDLKRREQALAILIEPDSRGRTIFEIASEALAVGLDCRWTGIAKVIAGNRARTLAMLADGHPRDPFEYDLDGTPCATLQSEGDHCLYPDRLAEHFPRDKVLIEMGAVSYRGHKVRNPNGESIAFIFAIDDKPMADESWRKDLIALVARWVAMTLLKLQAEEELRRNQERFRDFAEAASDWLWEMDEGLRFSYFSHDFHEKAGVAPARLLGKTREELLAAGDPIGGDRNVQPDWDAHLADLKAHRPFRNFVHPRAQADGSVRYMAINGSPIFDQAGSFKGYRGSARDVTERIVAEQDLRTSQVSLANAQRIARLGNWDWNIVTNELSWSDEIYRIFGLTPRQFGATFEAFLDRVHPNDRVNIQKVVDDALAGAPYSIDHRIVHPDGLVRIVHEQGEVDFDAGGKPVFMRGTVQDVTEQRQALAALAEREQRIRAITDNVGDALITIDTQGIIDSVNPAAERIFGYSAEEMLGRNVSMLMDAPDREQHDEYLAEYQRTRQAKILGVTGRELVARRKDGALIDIELSINEMSYGHKTLFLGAIRDITERQRARESERQRSLFVELSKTVSAAANEATSLSKALNVGIDQICTLIGWPLGHVYLLPGAESDTLHSSGIWYAADPDRYNDFMIVTEGARLARGTGVAGRALQFGRAECIPDTLLEDGDPRIEAARQAGIRAMYAFPIPAGSHIAGAIEFFSETPGAPEPAMIEVMEYVGAQLGRVVERATAERSLVAAKDAAECANRAKTEFLATMSHELRTPLNAIIGFSELMTDETFGPLGHGNYKDYAAGILKSGGHLLDIINDILDVSKAEAGRIVLNEESVDLAKSVQEALASIRQDAEAKALKIEVDFEPSKVRVRGDQARLKRILLNLLSNAVKFTAKGSIAVRLRATPETGVTLQVIDTGMGITENDIERVLEPFVQADSSLQRSHEGIGLGLPLSRTLAKLHGGTLSLESRFGAGTVATLRLPPGRLLKNADAA